MEKTKTLFRRSTRARLADLRGSLHRLTGLVSGAGVNIGRLETLSWDDSDGYSPSMGGADTSNSQGRIRRATVADAAEILAIYAPIVESSAVSFELEPPGIEEFADRMTTVMQDNPWLVMEHEGLIIGYAYATVFRSRPAYSHTRESSVYVHPGHHRKGVGRELMLALLEELSGRGAHRVVAGATLPNRGSAALHESLGFRYVGTFHEVGRKFDRWHDVGFWELSFDDR
ncbi:MAG: N-acetyltransferase family protein [Acidimicrobiia bacterium]